MRVHTGGYRVSTAYGQRMSEAIKLDHTFRASLLVLHKPLEIDSLGGV
jgi:hypothetical protein